VSLDAHLVLARFFLSKLQVRSINDLKNWQAFEDTRATGTQTVFFDAALGMATEDLREQLPVYDANLRDYESRLASRRKEFAGFKYFQYIALLASEYHLDRLTRDPEKYVDDLNKYYVDEFNKRRATAPHHAQFTLPDLRRLAFYLATGAGKTLLLHVHYWQLLRYLNAGREFGNILLLTPNAGLAQQHLQELKQSGIPARYLTEVKDNFDSVPPGTVLVVDMPKLRDKRAKDEAEAEGFYYPSLGQKNLVFADEGHKGTASLDKGWRQIREWLSEEGMLLEYSATFAQVLKGEEMVREYGKRILVDYHYRYFYQDQYGKDFQFIEIEADPDSLDPTAVEEATLMGGLLLHYVQLRHYLRLGDRARQYNLEKPLWTFVGHTVIKNNKGKEGELEEDAKTLADVAKVVRFFKRLTEEPQWAQGLMADAVKEPNFIGNSNPFKDQLAELQTEEPEELYRKVLETVMLGRGALELHLMPAQGEIGLKTSGAREYFGVINIGDTAGFKQHLEQNLGLTVGENPLYGQSLFQQINRADSPIQVLIGSRKFVEGWSSWRVSTMTLLNIGKNQGPLIVQLFGRGVRLLGQNRSLKRSGEHEVKRLETLYVLGLNATYMGYFLEAMKSEEINLERIRLDLQIDQPALEKPLPLPRLPEGFSFESRTLVFEPDDSTKPSVTLAPRINVQKGQKLVSQTAGEHQPLEPKHLAMLDWVSLRQKLLAYARAERIGNLSFSTKELQQVLQRGWYRLVVSKGDLASPEVLEQVALAILRKYLSEYYRRKLKEAQAKEMLPGKLQQEDLETHYEVMVSASSSGLLAQIKALAGNLALWRREGVAPLPRLYIDPNIKLIAVYQPLIYETKTHRLEDVQVKPAPLEESEYNFIQSLRSFWQDHHTEAEFASLKLYLMRNLSKKGLGFHNKTGFYPDFILWIEDEQTGSWRVVFVEPHGMQMEREDIANHPKLEVLTQLLPQLSGRPEFQKAGITLDGYMLTQTPASEIPGAKRYNSDWDRMAKETHLLVRERGDEANIRTIILGL